MMNYPKISIKGHLDPNFKRQSFYFISFVNYCTEDNNWVRETEKVKRGKPGEGQLANADLDRKN